MARRPQDGPQAGLCERLRPLIQEKDAEAVLKLIEDRQPLEVMRGVISLPTWYQDHFFQILPPDQAAELIRVVPEAQRITVMSHLESDDATEIFCKLDSHDQAQILHDLGPLKSRLILDRLDKTHAESLERLTRHDDDTAGGVMYTETLVFKPEDTVGGVLRRLGSEEMDRAHQNNQFYPYVTDDTGKLLGVVPILGILSMSRSTLVKDAMRQAISVQHDLSLLELDALFQEKQFFSLPVVDEEGRLLGAVYHDMVVEHLREKEGSNALKSRGVFGDEIRSMPLMVRSRRRLAWLSANIVLNVIAASVIAAYEETLAAVIAIAIFLPMVSDMSGCSGNQAVAVSLRELALGIVRPMDAFRVWLKEISVGVINGTALGILIGIVCWVWKGNPYLGLVIGLALTLNTLIAVSIGGVVPLLLKKFNTDPAVASGPLLTTITDMAGFFLVLSLAQLMMPLLVGS